MWNNQWIKRGWLIIISGPSGCGKGTVVEALCRADATLTRSVSVTTRSPRHNETDGVDYHFLSQSEFDDLIAHDGFLEWAEYGPHRYGTLKSTVESTMAAGKDLILEIDVQGAAQVKALGLKCVSIFILPPSFASLKKRLRERGTESKSELQQRLLHAKAELPYITDYDYCVINPDDRVDEAVEQIRHIISAAHCRIDCQLLTAMAQEFPMKLVESK